VTADELADVVHLYLRPRGCPHCKGGIRLIVKRKTRGGELSKYLVDAHCKVCGAYIHSEFTKSTDDRIQVRMNVGQDIYEKLKGSVPGSYQKILAERLMKV
jgi:hypothetical protein